MPRLARTLLLLLAAAAPATADELVGFDLSSFGKVVLSRNQFASDTLPEVAAGAYNNEFISTYSSQSVFAQIGRSVGRLDVATDAGVFPCTAFLVDDDLIMTNNHCVPGILDDPRTDANSIVGVRFVVGYTQEGVTEGTQTFLVDPAPVETSKPLDYTLLRILGDAPGRAYGKLALAATTPNDNDPYWIIGHPMGEAQRISREKCRANSPAVSDNQLLHTCDTLPGNSGSPVIDATSRRVIGLHHAGSARNSINYAIPMSAILAVSTVLSPATDAEEGLGDAEARALTLLSRALQIDDETRRRDALSALVESSPGTSAAQTASRLLAALTPPPPPEPTLAERMAADADVQACDRLAGDLFHPDRETGLMRAAGIVFEDIDPDPAIAACRRALDSFPDHPRMTAFLAEGLSAAERYDEAFAAYRAAARAGDVVGQAGLGISYQWALGTEEDFDLAREWLEQATAQGHPIAKTGLAVIYQRGQGVSPDPDRALRLFTEAAEAGYHGAQAQLGDFYRQGEIVAASEETAADWYERAAEQGNRQAQYQLALLLVDGQTLERDSERAIRWARAAAAQDHPQAMRLLGTLHFHGIGLEQSDAEAARWFRKAADHGDAVSLGDLAWMQETGRGLARDPDRAADLYVQALRAGNDWPANRDAADWSTEVGRALQRALAAEGVYSGATDGKVGRLTQEAMRRLLP